MRLDRRVGILTLVFATSLLLAGCSSATKELESSGIPFTTKSIGLAFPIKAEVDKTITIEFVHKSGDEAKNKKVKYLRIQIEDPISKAKIDEGEASPDREDRIRPYTTKYNEDFDAAVVENGDPYQEPVRILRKNFRGIQIVTKPKEEPAEVVFLQVKNPDTIGPNMNFFDVYLAETSTDALDTLAARNFSQELSLTDVLTDCGQVTSSTDPEEISETIQLGQSSLDEQSAQALKKKNYAPEEVGPISPDDQTISKIKAQNTGMDDLIDKYFVSSGNNPFLSSFRKIGSEQPQEHSSFSKDLSLSSDILGVKTGEFLDGAKFTMIVSDSDGRSSPVIEAEKDGKRYLFGAQVATKIIQASPTTGGQNIGVTNAEPESVPVSADPWCGFTPESKPAIYLYPKTLTHIKVKLNPPIGWITASIPRYPKSGWDVWALPNGTTIKGLNTYSHLFYEAMLPTPRMSASYEILSQDGLHNQLIELSQRLSLNKKESNELASYWTEKLPKSPYYKIGLLPRAEIDKIEPFSISPKPDSIYRLRLLFEPINERVPSTGVQSESFARNGFTVVEWGGFVLN